MAARRILVVDDEDDIRTVARVALERVGGHTVLAASSGAEGIELARRERPDAIVLDMMMPGMDGPSTFRALADDATTADIPVVFLTAKAQAADRVLLEGLGAAGVLAKPFDPLTLHTELAALLGWE
ncbi:MAG TPA: response regulator [Acidimicrobiales bacterium]|nr:response regulator [Acidimicrobiales bacterium]